MFSIWAKTQIKEKIKLNELIEFEDKFIKANFFDYVSKICNELDIPTPVILKKHINHFSSFNIATFSKEDFIEYIDFDKLILEFCKDEKVKPSIIQ
jgi:hypothetical protein